MLDEALIELRAVGNDLRNGNTNHAPMVVEALCARGRGDAVRDFLDRYGAQTLPRPAARERIDPARWRDALTRVDRFADWSEFFSDELANAPWREVLDRWVGRLAPGFCAAACHGAIRVGHAARGLGGEETAPRLDELADALASWASTYQRLLTAREPAVHAFAPQEAIARVRIVPPAERRFSGTIVSALGGLDRFPDFANAIGLLDTERVPADIAADLAEVFARVIVANVHDTLTAIVFTHGVTVVAALANLLPHLRDETARAAIPYAWQAGAGLYAAFGSEPIGRDVPAPELEPEPADALFERAIAHGDEHAIKLAEACLGLHAVRPSPVYGAAARKVLDLLPCAG